MNTPLDAVYKFFLARISSDEWTDPDDIEIYERDWEVILSMAIPNFLYPRKNINIDIDAGTFMDELTNAEIQVLAILMREEWLKRCINSLENIRMGYDERDWSQGSHANHLDKLIKYLDITESERRSVLFNYSRQIDFAPNPIFGQLAGDV